MNPIIPPALAFCGPLTLESNAVFPNFPRDSCNWPELMKLIQQPRLVWRCWEFKDLGQWSSLAELWEAWDEGAAIPGIGRCPPIRLVEREWGEGVHADRGTRREQQWREVGMKASIHTMFYACSKCLNCSPLDPPEMDEV